MIAAPCRTYPASPGLCTLDSLRTLRADALRPEPALGFKEVRLQELGIGWDNAFQEILVRRASDVFACAAAAGGWYDPLPPGARLVYAVFRFHVTGAGRPWFAEIWPPHILTLSPGYAADPIKRWLAARGFLRTDAGV